MPLRAWAIIAALVDKLTKRAPTMEAWHLLRHSPTIMLSLQSYTSASNDVKLKNQGLGVPVAATETTIREEQMPSLREVIVLSVSPESKALMRQVEGGDCADCAWHVCARERYTYPSAQTL